MRYQSNEEFLNEMKEYVNKKHSKEEMLRLLYTTEMYTKKGKLKKQFRDNSISPSDDFKKFMRSFCKRNNKK